MNKQLSIRRETSGKDACQKVICRSPSYRHSTLLATRYKVYHGFTLIELLVVMTVISILAAMLLPVLSQARESASLTSCMSNLKQCGVVLSLYADEASNWYPPDSHAPFAGWPWLDLQYPSRMGLNPYIGNNLPRIFYCPYRPLYYEVGSVRPTNWSASNVSRVGYGYMACTLSRAWPSAGYECRGYANYNSNCWIKAAMKNNIAAVRRWDGK